MEKQHQGGVEGYIPVCSGHVEDLEVVDLFRIDLDNISIHSGVEKALMVPSHLLKLGMPLFHVRCKILNKLRPLRWILN